MGYRLIRGIAASKLAQSLGLELLGVDAEITGVSGYKQAEAQDLTFNTDHTPTGDHTCIAFVKSSIPNSQMPHIVSKQPRLDFVRALALLDNEPGFEQNTSASDIHPTAIIGENVTIEPGCLIGEGVVISHHVVLHSGTKIGKNSVVRAGAVIGAEGFGYARLPNGKPLKFKHFAGVAIGEHVEIGSNNTICRGALNDTLIEDYVKMDGLVHVGHNCHIKSGALLTACAELSGGVTIGENAWIGPNASIIEKVSIGSGALVGIGSVVTKNVDKNSVVAGNPAKFLRKI